MKKVDMIGLTIGLGGLLLGAISLIDSQQQRKEDKQDHHRQSQPSVHYVAHSVKVSSGYTYLTLENKSPIAPAAITSLAFEVTEPDQLSLIARTDPRRTSPLAPGEIKATSPNDVDDVLFTRGNWIDANTYHFTVYTSYHIAPSGVTDIKLAILDPLLDGKQFDGTLFIVYGGKNSPLKLSPVSVRGRSRK